MFKLMLIWYLLYIYPVRLKVLCIMQSPIYSFIRSFESINIENCFLPRKSIQFSYHFHLVDFGRKAKHETEKPISTNMRIPRYIPSSKKNNYNQPNPKYQPSSSNHTISQCKSSFDFVSIIWNCICNWRWFTLTKNQARHFNKISEKGI